MAAAARVLKAMSATVSALQAASQRLAAAVWDLVPAIRVDLTADVRFDVVICLQGGGASRLVTCVKTTTTATATRKTRRRTARTRTTKTTTTKKIIIMVYCHFQTHRSQIDTNSLVGFVA